MLESLSKRSAELQEKGYTCNFQVEDGKLTIPDKAQIECTPDQIEIHHVFRFEGESNPADLSILYALETHQGDKGVLVDGYGAYNSEEVTKFMRKVPNHLSTQS